MSVYTYSDWSNIYSADISVWSNIDVCDLVEPKSGVRGE